MREQTHTPSTVTLAANAPIFGMYGGFKLSYGVRKPCGIYALTDNRVEVELWMPSLGILDPG